MLAAIQFSPLDRPVPQLLMLFGLGPVPLLQQHGNPAVVPTSEAGHTIP